jgi:hypothetical protein
MLFLLNRCIVILQYKYIAMGITKTEYFTEEQNELAILAKAHYPARIAIIASYKSE